MSTAVEEDVRATAAPSKGKPCVWHNAATWADWVRAVRGQKYTAMCGKTCQGAGGELRLRDSVAPMEHCVVCRELTS